MTTLTTQPTVTLDTEVGPIEVTFTEANHAYVTTDGRYGSTTPNFVTYRGQQFRASVHLYAEADWTPGAKYAPTVAKLPFGAGDAARTHREAIVNAISGAVRTYAQENPQVLAQAERFKLENDLFRAQSEENEAGAAYLIAQEKRQAVEAKLIALSS